MAVSTEFDALPQLTKDRLALSALNGELDLMSRRTPQFAPLSYAAAIFADRIREAEKAVLSCCTVVIPAEAAAVGATFDPESLEQGEPS